MRPNLQISHKGLILVSVPLIFEVLFIVILVFMLNQADNVARREAQSKELVSQANELSKTIFDAGLVLLTWQYYKENTSLLKRYCETVAGVPAVLSRMKELTADNSRQRQHIIQMEEYAKKTLALYERYGKAPLPVSGATEPDDYAISINDFRHQMSLTYQPLLREAKLLASEEQKQREIDPHAEERSKAAVRLLILAGIFLNVLITFALAVFFSRGITKRLAVLGDNALRLAKKQPLHQPVAGSDEIARLDKLFRHMAVSLERADARKQEFVSMITHDLRSPLSSLQGNIGLVLEGFYGPLPEKALERMIIADQNVTRLITMINELLDLEKIEAGLLALERSPARLSTIVQDAIESVEDMAKRNDVTITAPPSTHHELNADAKRIVQVLVNLLSNAIKFSPAGGSITISIEENGDQLTIGICDQGPGIAAEDLARVFDRFQQAEQSQGSRYIGSGLGLAICKALVEAHGGKIGVRSVRGQGSTFWFELPLPALAVEPSAQRQ